MSRYNHRNKWTQRDYIIRTLSVIFLIAIFVLFMPKESVRTYYYHEGGVWDYPTLIAEDSFPVLKSKEQLAREKDSVIHDYEPYFLYDKSVMDSAVQNW
ncbi:MAG: hypothetical protein IIW42_07470, partial [Bacteroidaceae bacterium]|nr:hypothetical protein [Bacteroidaceae bacterium]